jgi:hypothetical protein
LGSIGATIAIADTVRWSEAEAIIDAAEREYEKIFKSASDQLRAALTFRGTDSSILRMMN